MKFHHMRIGPESGSPPSSSTLRSCLDPAAASQARPGRHAGWCRPSTGSGSDGRAVQMGGSWPGSPGTGLGTCCEVGSPMPSNNASVIWRLLRPLATRASASRSRGVRPSWWRPGRWPAGPAAAVDLAQVSAKESGSRPGRRAARRGCVPRRSTQAAGEQAPLSSITMPHHWFIRLLRCLLRSRRRRLQPPAWGERSRIAVSGLACRACGRPPAGRTG